ARLTAITFDEKLLKEHDYLLISTCSQYHQTQPALDGCAELMISRSPTNNESEKSY
ncbi:hypothetical protein JMJ77_0002483, partial [Colletotrichum scovillei]